MQPITNLALEVTAIHSVIGFQVTDHWLDGISPFDEFSLRSPPPPKLPLIQRIRETLFGRPKPIDPSEKYPPIEIA
jgi:hypothetical protein